MPLNQFFQNTPLGGTNNNEFNLLEDLAIESIKIHGVEIYYIPRTLVEEDVLYGDDPLSAFNAAAPIEVYVKNVEGFEGEGDFLSKFGLEIRDQITFTVSRKRFNQIQDESVLTQVGYNLLTEDGGRFLVEDASGSNYTLSLGRPREGDLIYFPITQKVYEIKFVEHEAVFYQLGKLYTYDMRCELFEYSSNKVDTGLSFIDEIEDDLSTDERFFTTLTEGGDNLVTEGGDRVILEEYSLEAKDVQANNSFFESEIFDEDIIDFDESNPFGERVY